MLLSPCAAQVAASGPTHEREGKLGDAEGNPVGSSTLSVSAATVGCSVVGAATGDAVGLALGLVLSAATVGSGDGLVLGLIIGLAVPRAGSGMQYFV